MLEHRIQDVVLFAIEFRVFVKGKVPRAADTLYRAQHVGSLAFQYLEFFAHIFSGGREFYGLDRAEQRYFRTTLWIFRGLRPCSAERRFCFFPRWRLRNRCGRWLPRTGSSAVSSCVHPIARIRDSSRVLTERGGTSSITYLLRSSTHQVLSCLNNPNRRRHSPRNPVLKRHARKYLR